MHLFLLFSSRFPIHRAPEINQAFRKINQQQFMFLGKYLPLPQARWNTFMKICSDEDSLRLGTRVFNFMLAFENEFLTELPEKTMSFLLGDFLVPLDLSPSFIH